MTNIFVTGGTGNIGRLVVSELVRRDYSVTALTRSLVKLDGARMVVGSLEDLGTVEQMISRADGIIHLACARTHERKKVIDTDITGTGKLIDAWRRGNFVYASSQTVYGVPKGDLTEEVLLDPVTWYDLGKVCNEFQVQMAAGEAGRGAGINLRMALLFDAGTHRSTREFLDIVYDECIRGTTFVFDNDEGLETFGTSYIGDQDLARAIVDSLSLKKSGPFNVAGGYCTWRSLIETINRKTGSRSQFVVRNSGIPVSDGFRLPQSRSYVDASRFEGETGFSARQSMDELMDRYVRARK